MDGIKTKLNWGKTLHRLWFPFVVFSIFMILLIGKDRTVIVSLQIFQELVGLFLNTDHRLVFGFQVLFLLKDL